jgi:hypothetical protein
MAFPFKNSPQRAAVALLIYVIYTMKNYYRTEMWPGWNTAAGISPYS